jgi:hypothetical protein
VQSIELPLPTTTTHIEGAVSVVAAAPHQTEEELLACAEFSLTPWGTSATARGPGGNGNGARRDDGNGGAARDRDDRDDAAALCVDMWLPLKVGHRRWIVVGRCGVSIGRSAGRRGERVARRRAERRRRWMSGLD